MKDILLITPPFTQLNTPYPATPYLKGFLNTISVSSFQMDLGIEVILAVFSQKGLQKVFEFAHQQNNSYSENSKRIVGLKNDYLKTIDNVILFLQNKNQTLAHQICSHNFLPQASRFNEPNDLEWAFGEMGLQDKAKHLSTLYLEDLSDFISECVDDKFGFSRYAEQLGRSANSFDELYELLLHHPTFIDNITLTILENKLHEIQPKMVCFSVPFPGNLYSALRCAQFIKSSFPHIPIVMGGGFANTELRSLTDPRVFDFFDYITLDKGELPLQIIITNLLNPEISNSNHFKRTFIRLNGKVEFCNSSTQNDIKPNETGTPDYSDLYLTNYISVIEMANPMHSLWSDGRWNKLTMANGCYWGKCTFCDTTLDYIQSFEPYAVELIVDRMQQIIEQTNQRGFHFVDEAAPPALMRDLAIEIIKRKLIVTWWTNIRFEKSFTQDLCQLLKASGCIAVSGGLEVASDRLLSLINKGVTVEQVAQVTNHFTQAGMMVHAYLMYGFPSQTVQETIDSLEMVRQLFEQGAIHSAFWHKFALTAHSPIGLNPEKYGISPDYHEITFANNDVQFNDKTGIDHSKFSYGLKKSVLNFMHGIGFDLPVQEWFDFKTPKTTLPINFIHRSISTFPFLAIKPTAKIIWMGETPTVTEISKTKRGETRQLLNITIHTKAKDVLITIDKMEGIWLLEALNQSSIYNSELITYSQLKTDFEAHFSDFELFWHSRPILALRSCGLLAV